MSQFSNNPSPGQTQAPAGSGQLVVVGVVIAVLAVILMNIYVEMRVAARDEKTITLFKYAGALEPGDIIEANDLVPIQIAESNQNAYGLDAVREDAPGSKRPADGVGFPLFTSVAEGEVLKSSHFLASANRVGRNDPQLGERQIALSIESEEQPADLTPGDRVDLLGAVRMSRDTEYETIMEYVEIASVGERRTESADGGRANRYGKITINVTLEQSKMLYAIRDRLQDKKFIIALRAPNDTATPETGGEAIINPDVIEMLRLR